MIRVFLVLEGAMHRDEDFSSDGSLGRGGIITLIKDLSYLLRQIVREKLK